MIIIFGMKDGQVKPDPDRTSTQVQCSVCGQVGMFRPVKQGRFFTLFWIPLIPLGSKKAVQCPNCGSLFKA